MRFQMVKLSAVILAMGLAAAGCGGHASGGADRNTAAQSPAEESADADSGDGFVVQTESEPARGGHKAEQTKAVSKTEEDAGPDGALEEGMDPVSGEDIKDGIYPVKVDSSSNMFRITECELTVKEGSMSAVMTMGGTGYLKLYMGTGEQALKAPETEFIPYEETADGHHTFKVPVKALDEEIECSAFSSKKETWYDRILVFCGDSLPADAFADGKVVTPESLGLEDGRYTVSVEVEGGSGRAFVESPAELRVEGGRVYASIVWSSANYDYMKADGVKYDLLRTEGNSSFEIPVTVFDRRMPVIADTIAMSEPHEIEYTLVFDSATLKKAE